MFEEPYAIQSNGVLQGIAWKSKGGHRVILDDKGSQGRQNVSFTVSFFGNDPFFAEVMRNHRPADYVSTFSLTKLASAQGGGGNLPQVGSMATGAKTGFKASHISFGGSNSKFKDPKGIVVFGVCTDLQPESSLVTREMVTTVKRQKLWISSNFRITIGGVVIDDALSFDPIELDYVPYGDLDGDGVVDMALTGDSFTFEISKFSKYASTVFEPALAATRSGSPKELPAKIEYLDEDGNTILSLSFPVIVNGVDPSDMFFDPTAPANNIWISTKIRRTIPVDVERPSGGI